MTPRDTLKAGGLVPHSTRLGKDDAVDSVVARGYRHPALPGRVVVRLTAENVAAGDDLEMATLGFGAGEDRGPVGKERKRPLGFPGWALVHDPKNARYALDVVKDFKKHARKAKSKPGHAKEGIDALAAKLGKTVPQFLPSFYEEAGRAFIEQGSPSYAAAMFGKAREAEAVHALEVDEQHRVDGFLEFALAGAVTTKALTEYAKDLADHHEPRVAYRHFRQLCLQRTLGGMPPWAGMAKDLRRLARAAKLDPDDEDGRLIAEIIESPALGKAAGEFWRAYQAPIAALCKASPAARGALLNLFPTGATYSADLDDAWLDLVEQSGAIDALVGDAPEEARPSGGRAAWFNKLTQHLARNWRNAQASGRAFALLRRMAPRLVEDGAPTACCGRWNQLDLDLAELALELGIAVEPPEGVRLNLEAWGKHGVPDRARDPVRAAQHPTLGPLLVAAVAHAIGGASFDSQSRGKLGFLAAKRAWLEGLLRRAESMALPAVDEVLATIAAKVKPETFAELQDPADAAEPAAEPDAKRDDAKPGVLGVLSRLLRGPKRAGADEVPRGLGLYARFAALDLAPALARTLQIGLLDEFGWPAVEDAARELSPDGRTDLALHGGLPAVVLASKTRAIAVGPRGRLGAHDLVVPAKHELATIRYVAGQFLVVLKHGWGLRAYWSSAPRDVFDSEVSHWQVPQIAARAVVLPDGAWQEGARAIRVGDRTVPQAGLACHDGTTAWTFERKEARHRLREISASGEPGRLSWPAWLETRVAPDWQVDADSSYVLPAPDGLARSPLGLRDGMLGARIACRDALRTPESARELVAIDGRSWRGSAEHQVTALVELPSGESRPVLAEQVWNEGLKSSLLGADGTVRGARFSPGDARYWRGSVAPYPDPIWHALVPRDVAGSKRLRAITERDARALIDGLHGIRDLADPAAITPAAKVVAKLLPEVTHAQLRLGVAGVVALAAQLEAWRDRLRDERAPGKASARAAPSGPDDAALKAALGGWVEYRYNAQGSAVQQIARCGELFRSRDRSERVVFDDTASTVAWLPLAVAPGALAFLATAIEVPADQRRALAELLAVLAGELPDPARLRYVCGRRTTDIEVPEARSQIALRWHGKNAYATIKRLYSGGDDDVEVLEYAPDGAFKPLPWVAPSVTICGGPAMSAQAIAAVATGAPRASREDAGPLAAATGLTPSEAVYVLAGCPRCNERTANFLDKEHREALGLKAAQAAVARDALVAIPRVKRLAALDDAGRGRDLAQAWIRHVGKRIGIPEALIAEADGELQAPIPPSQALAMFAAAADAASLNRDAQWQVNGTGDLVQVGANNTASEAFTIEVLQTACAYLPFLYAELPVGDALRAQAPVAHQRVLARLANPSLLYDLGVIYAGDDAHSLDALFSALGGEPIAGLDDGITGRLVPGAMVIRHVWSVRGAPREMVQLKVKLRPATLDAKAAATVGRLAAQVHSWGYAAWPAVQFMRSGDLAAMMTRIGDTPVPPGGWEQNPAASVPGLVEKAAGRLGISKDAAALYLQYLALLWPTARNVATWNGWKPKQIEAASAELENRELILAAKRERAQRGYFLPGGWEALRAPHPPMESWKLALYGRRTAEGAAVPTLSRFAALAPFHLLFERAWQRIESGDVPKYEEVKR